MMDNIERAESRWKSQPQINANQHDGGGKKHSRCKSDH